MLLILGAQESWRRSQNGASGRLLGTWVSKVKLSKEFSALLPCGNYTHNKYVALPSKQGPFSCEVDIRGMFQTSCNCFFMFSIRT